MAKSGQPKPTPLGLNVSRLRDLKGWSQVELARRAGVSSVAMIESGARQKPQFETVQKIAVALGVEPEVLYGESGAEAPMTDALRAFLRSPEGRDVTPDEVAELRNTKARGKRPTSDTYYWALKSLRSMTPEDEA